MKMLNTVPASRRFSATVIPGSRSGTLEEALRSWLIEPLIWKGVFS